MNDTASKLNKILETKAAIRQAIIDKGVEVGEDTVFADYSNKIAEISSGSDDFLALKTSNHTNYNSLFAFYEGESIEGFGIDTWDTSNVINMSGMFQHCGSLTELDLSNFNTGNVREIGAIFVYCISLETLDIRNFDLTRAFDYSYMIVECPKLHTLRLDNCSNDTINKIIGSDGFPTGEAEDYDGTRKMFVREENITGLTAPDGWIFVDADTGEEIVPEPEIPLYVLGEFRDNSEIAEVTTMVNETHTDLSYMFFGCTNLTTINGIDQWNTSNVTNMNNMFIACSSLTTLDLSSFDTSNVTTMKKMFFCCFELTTLDLNSFDTSNVTDMNNMFFSCESLTTLDLSSFNTSNVTDMNTMFQECYNLTTLDLSSFDTSNVTDMGAMFCNCESLTTLDLSSFDASNVTSMGGMFYGCNKLHTLRLDNCSNDTISKIITSGGFPTGTIEGVQRKIYVNPDNVSDLTAPSGWIFVDCITGEIIESIPLYIVGEFQDNKEITEVEVMVNDTHTDLSNMFSGCHSLTTINGIEDWDTSNVTNMSAMFYSCYDNLTSLDVSSFDTSNVTTMKKMFSLCNALRTLDLSSFDTSNVTDMTSMFNNCSKLKSVNTIGWDTSNVTYMSAMFQWCESLTELDLTHFDISNVINMSSMFLGCYRLTSLDLSSWDVSKLKYSLNYNSTFSDCTALTNFKAPKNISAAIKFDSCVNLTHESLMSIINNLATVTSTTKLTLGETNLAKLTDEEKAIAINKGWTLE